MSCRSFTKKGLPCKIKCKPNENFCHVHKNKDNESNIIEIKEKSSLSHSLLVKKKENEKFVNLVPNHNDYQNVHKADISSSVNKNIELLKSKYNYTNYFLLTENIIRILKVEIIEIENNPKKEYLIKKTGIFSSIYTFFTGNDRYYHVSKYISNKIDNYNHFLRIMNNVKEEKFTDVARYVMYYIINHSKDLNTKRLLCHRFVDEVIDGKHYCIAGKIARMINVFSGIDNELVYVNEKEELQNEMSRISKMELSQRRGEADIIFNKLNINQEERIVWLDALLDE